MICKPIPKGCVFLLKPATLPAPLPAALWDRSRFRSMRTPRGSAAVTRPRERAAPNHSGTAAKQRAGPAPAASRPLAGVCGSQTGCRLNNPPFLKRVVPEGQGCLQWGGGVRGNCLRGCFHNARTVNKFSLLYSRFPRVSHQKRE